MRADENTSETEKKATKAFYPEFLDEDGFGLLDALQRERMDEEPEKSR